MELHSKILTGLERISEVFKTLLWEKAKVHGISPIQIQILLFVNSHRLELCNVSHLAKEFNVSKPTISDAVKVLLKKELLEKDHSPTDNRRYNLFLPSKGEQLINSINDYAFPVSEEIQGMNKQESENLFATISKLIYQLNQKGVIQVQRTCYGCRFYDGNKSDQHFCNFLNKKLKDQEIKIDCADFEKG